MPSVCVCRVERPGNVMAKLRAVVLSLTLALAAASCTGQGESTTEPPQASETTTPSDQAKPSTRPAAGDCPVTAPRPVDRRYAWRPRLFGWGSSYGNGQLWVGGLGPHGVIDRLDWKLGWWREVPGRLRIDGRRLDAAAPSLRTSVPSGYGRAGFQASGVAFPAEGCWQVTGRVDQASLTFVTLVARP
jgi:hypothetical protein